MKSVLFLIVISLISFKSFALECVNRESGSSFEFQAQKALKEDRWGIYAFSDNEEVTVTETKANGETYTFIGNIIFQSRTGITKHARMAHYIFKLSDTPESSNSVFGKYYSSLSLSIYGIDVFQDRIRCVWL